MASIKRVTVSGFSSTPAQSDVEALAIEPAPVFHDFLPLLALGRSRTTRELAAGMGSRDLNQPRRAIQRFLTAGRLFGLLSDDGGHSSLTGRGRAALFSNERRKAALLRAFTTEPIPRDVFALIGREVQRDQFIRRLASIGRGEEASFWLCWLEASGAAMTEGMTIRAKSDALSPLDAFDNDGFAAAEEVVYRRFQMTTELLGEGPSVRLRRHMDIFRCAKPDDAEAAMCQLVREGLGAVGFIVQTKNGPRDGDADETRLRFGPKGDDAIALYISDGIAMSSSAWGWALGIELKRTYVDKKAVTQAAAAEARIKKHYGNRITTYPLVISGEHGFADRAGREYADSHGVVHLPAVALVALAEEQQRRVSNAERLITPADLLGAIHRWRARVELAPTSTDIMNEVLLRFHIGATA